MNDKIAVLLAKAAYYQVMVQLTPGESISTTAIEREEIVLRHMRESWKHLEEAESLFNRNAKVTAEQNINTPLLTQSVVMLWLPRLLEDNLIKSGINTVGDVALLTESLLKELPRISNVDVEQIKRALADKGLKLRD
jgi:DNA-directed RNA polymerase alpha subunit